MSGGESAILANVSRSLTVHAIAMDCARLARARACTSPEPRGRELHLVVSAPGTTSCGVAGGIIHRYTLGMQNYNLL